MTSSPALLRLRLALEKTTGPRLIISREDLSALLPIASAQPSPPAVNGPQGTNQAAAPVVTAPRGQRHVALAVTVEDAKRLARAAWDSVPERVAEHGRFDDADPALAWHTVQAALTTLQHLVGSPAPTPITSVAAPPAAAPGPAAAVPAQRTHPGNDDEEPPF